MARIETRKQLESWLNEQPREVCAAIAARAALRVFPLVLRPKRDFELQKKRALLTGRCILTAGVAAKMTISAVADAATVAVRAIDHEAWAVSSLIDAATHAAATRGARGAAAAAEAAIEVNAVHAAIRAVISSESAAYAAPSSKTSAVAAAGNFTAATYADLGVPVDLMLSTSLWHSPSEPDWLLETLNARPQYAGLHGTWSFWNRWYQGFLVGDPMPWELQRRIAAEIEEETWAEGPEAVAEAIREIEDAYWADHLPQHEFLERDQDTGLFEVFPEVFDQEVAVENWLNQIEFATNLAVEANTNDFNPMNVAYKYLAHTLENCRNDPNAIEQNLGIAVGVLEGNLGDPEFHKDDSVRSLRDVASQIQTQMRADHPEVRHAWEKRLAQKVREVSRETQLEAASAIRLDKLRTRGRLLLETELDAQTVESGESAEAKAVALRRSAGRSAKMNWKERAAAKIHEADGSAPYKAGRMGSTGWSLVEMISKFFGG